MRDSLPGLFVFGGGMNLLEKLNGSKTFLCTAAMAAATLLYVGGGISFEQFLACQSIFGAGAAASLRHALQKNDAQSRLQGLWQSEEIVRLRKVLQEVMERSQAAKAPVVDADPIGHEIARDPVEDASSLLHWTGILVLPLLLMPACAEAQVTAPSRAPLLVNQVGSDAEKPTRDGFWIDAQEVESLLDSADWHWEKSPLTNQWRRVRSRSTLVAQSGAAPLSPTADPAFSGSAAKPPRAIIQGPSHVIPGELIVLDASQSDGADNFRWSISPELKGRKQLIEMDGGKRCQIASYGGRYVVTLAVSNAAGIDLLTWEIRVDGNAPCPPPEPQPVDPIEPDPIKPEPVKPVDPPPSPMPQPVDPVPAPIQPPAAGEFGLAPKVFDLAKAAKSSTRVADCQMLASECKRIAASDWANLNAIASEIVSVLKKLPTGWEDLAKSVQTAIAELYQAGKIKNTGDIKRLLLEVAAAFDLAGKVK